MGRRKAEEGVAAFDALMGDDNPKIDIPVVVRPTGDEVEVMNREGRTRRRTGSANRLSGGGLEELRVPARLSGKDHFEKSGQALEVARSQFRDGLSGLAGRSLPLKQLREVVAEVNRLSETLFLALRLGDGPIVTLRFNEANDCVEVKPLGGRKPLPKVTSWPSFVPVPIEALPVREAVSAIGVLLGRRQASRLTPEVRRVAAAARHHQMTAEHMGELGRRGGAAAAENMTAEERSERGRRAAEARWARARGKAD